MFKRTKKVLSLLLVAIMSLNLVACASNGDKKKEEKPESKVEDVETMEKKDEADSKAEQDNADEDDVNDPADSETDKKVGDKKDEDEVAEEAQEVDAALAAKDDEPKDVITITTFYETGEIPTEDNVIAALMKEDLGVVIEAEYLVGDLDQRIGLMTASGEYPDIMQFNQKVVDAGGARAYDDLLPEYENLYNHYERYLKMMESPEDGHIYYLPNFGVVHGDEIITDHFGTGNFIQKAVLEEAGYPEITTLDEFFDVIEAYMEKHPTIDGAPTIGFTILNDSWRNFGLVNPPQFLSGHQNNGNCVVDENDVASDPSTTDIAKRYYQKLNEINKKGILDREFASMNYDQYIQKLSSGNVLATMDQKWSMNDANIALGGAGKIERQYVSIPLVYDKDIQEHYRDQTIVNLNNGFMLTTVEDDKVDAIMTFLNDVCTEKWSKLLNWGIEGEAYEVDENGKFYRTEEQREEQRDPKWNLKNQLNAFNMYVPKLEGTYSDGNVYGPGNDPDEFYASLEEYDKKFLDAYDKKTWAEFYTQPGPNPIWYPTWNITTLDGTPEAIAGQKASDVKIQMLPGVIMADDFDKAWDEYVEEYEKCNYDIMIDHINEQIQWRKDNWTVEDAK